MNDLPNLSADVSIQYYYIIECTNSNNLNLFGYCTQCVVYMRNLKNFIAEQYLNGLHKSYYLWFDPEWERVNEKSKRINYFET